MEKLKTTKEPDDNNYAIRKQNLNRTLLVLVHRREYDKIKDLRDTMLYHGKLMSYYGYDMKSGRWNTSLFPITRTDKDIEGIYSDIEKYNIAAEEYRRYREYLSRKYYIDALMQAKKGLVMVPRDTTRDR